MTENPLYCDQCHKAITPGGEVDHGYRNGPDLIEIEVWLCPECDQYVYDEAMSHIGVQKRGEMSVSDNYVRMLRNIADELEAAEALRQEIERLRDVDAAARTACTAYLARTRRPEEFSEAMKRLYNVTREDLWEESRG